MAQMLPILLLFLATFTPKATAEKPGPLTVTVDPHYISNVRHFDVYLKQAEEDNEYYFEDCANPTVSMTNPIKFTLDWSKCPRAVVRPDQLRHMQIEIHVVYKRGVDQNKMDIALENYSDGFYRRVFGGGKASLVKFLKIDGFSKQLKEFPKLVYFEDPTGTHIPPAATLTFNVEYQHRTVSSIRHVEVEHASSNSDSEEEMREVEMGECQPEHVMGGKFALDLAKCNVHDMGDFMNLLMELRVALKKGLFPNRVEGRTELVKFGMLSNAPKEVLHQLYSGAHQLNLLLSEEYKPMITLNGQNWATVQQSSSASTSSHAHQHASSSSTHAQAHAVQLIPKSQKELSAAESGAGYFRGEKLPSSIAFLIPRKILKGPPREIIHQGRSIFIDSRDIKLVNNEQHKMRLWHADGAECPVKAHDFRGISAVLDIDWTKCKPNPLRSHEELEGMELVVYYQLDQDEPTKIRHTFKQDEPLKFLFRGSEACRLELLEDGSVKFAIPPAGTLTFNVEYQHRAVSSIRRMSVTHPPNFKLEMDECQPKNVEMRGKIIKFALDLAKCNVHDLKDFMDLHMDLRVALQKGQYPNRVEGRTEWVEFKTLAGHPEDVLRQLYSGAQQMNILLSEQYKSIITMNGQNWANVWESSSDGTSSHPQQHAGPSSSTHGHALQLLPKSREEIAAQEAIAGYFRGRKLASRIAFWIPRKMLEGPKRVIKHNGGYITVNVRDIHLVNDEQHKMRIWHADGDGDECPVEIAGNFDSISAVLDIDWTKCTPNPLKSHEELEGMELVVYYQLDKDEPTVIRHTFKQDEPLQDVFGGAIIGRLELFEDGRVVFKRNA